MSGGAWLNIASPDICDDIHVHLNRTETTPRFAIVDLAEGVSVHIRTVAAARALASAFSTAQDLLELAQPGGPS